MLTLQEKIDRHERIPESGCWIYMGALQRDGYGVINIGRRGEGQKLAHRLSYELHNGPIPQGLSVLHHCDTPSCINPNHLFLGTSADNLADMRAKCREKKFCKFTPSEVDEIRTLSKSGIRQREIAKKYGISQSYVSEIKNERKRVDSSLFYKA